MGKVNLEAKEGIEGIFLSYLNEFASDDLAKRINEGTKTLKQAVNYVYSEAKKQATEGCACIEDKTVYGWVIHFFEEDAINGEDYNKAPMGGAKVTTSNAPAEPAAEAPQPKQKAKAAKVAAPQLDQIGFDFGW